MKRFLSLFLTLVLLISLAACAQGGPGGTEANDPTGAPTAGTTLPTEPDTKTVWFQTAQTNVTPAVQMTTETTYDDAGRLIGYRVAQTYPSMDTVTDRSLSYEYASDGRIGQIILSVEGGSIPLEASYEGGRLTGYWGAYEDQRFGLRFVYNDDGRIAQVYMQEDENEKEMISLEYYASGALRQRVIHDMYEMTTVYNEQGQVLQQQAYDAAAALLIYRHIYEYDAQGNQVLQESYSMGSTEPVSVVRMKYDAQGHCIEMETGGNGQSVQMTGTWDAAAKTVTFTGEVDGAAVNIQSTYDDAGRVIHSKTQTGDVTMQENTTTYVSMELPADYEKPSLLDPVYLIFMLGA